MKRHGDRRTARLTESDGHLEFIDKLGRRTDLSHHLSALSAISCQPQLCDIRANEATIFDVAAGGPDIELLMGVLRVTEPASLLAEEPVELPADLDDGAEPGDALHPVSRRVVVANGQRLVIVAPPGRPVLCRRADSRNWESYPAIRVPLVSFSCIEEASMVSGSSSWSFGLLGNGLVAEVGEPNDQPAELTVERHQQGNLERLVARWLADRSSDVGVDLVMLAAETLLGTFADAEVPASAFDDDASETLMCSLAISGLIPQLLASFGAAGRGDVEAAIRRPTSQPGRRRAARLRRYQAGLDETNDG